MARTLMNSSSGEANSSQEYQIESSNPLFVHPSNNPSSILVSKQFDGSGFTAWKRGMIIALSAKNKLGFINGEVLMPAEDSASFSAWTRCNFMVISWILNALDKDIAESVIYLSTAQEIWYELIERFEQANGTMIFQIQKDLFSISQGIDTVSSYYTRIKRIWDELRAFQGFPECSCGSATKLGKYFEDQKLFQFLMGLNDSFTAVRGHILLMSPLPSVNQAYSMLVHEEKQKEVSIPTTPFANDTAAMNVGNMKSNSNGPRPDQNRKPSVICNYCKKPGHTKDKCYKLHGYPPDFKFQRGRKFSGAVQGDVPDDSQSQIQSQPLPQIYGEQYNHLLALISQLKSTDQSPQMGLVNLASASFADGRPSRAASQGWNLCKIK